MKDYTNGPAPGFLRLWWRKGAMAPLLLAFFTVLMTAGSYQSLKLGLAFDADGVIVEAVSTDRRENTVFRNDRTETDYYVTFRYSADGSDYSVEKQVGRRLYDTLVPGQTRDIRYLAGSPRQMEHTIGKTWQDGQVMRWMSLAFGLGALGAFWWTARPAMEAIRARKFGRAEWATVQYVAERKKSTKNGSRTMYALVWTDREYSQGESRASGSDARYQPYASGTKIEVYRDSRGKTWWVGDVGPRAAAPTVPDAGKSRS